MDTYNENNDDEPDDDKLEKRAHYGRLSAVPPASLDKDEDNANEQQFSCTHLVIVI